VTAAVLRFPGKDQPRMTVRRPTPMRPQVETRDLWKWVDLLTRDRKEKLHRRLPGQRKSTVEYVDVPSLWTQMREAVASSNSGGGHGKSASGSRSPMDLALAALLMEVEKHIVDGLAELGARARVQVEQSDRVTPRRPAPRLAVVGGWPLIEPQHAGLLAERARRAAADQADRADTARLAHDVHSDLRQLATLAVGTGDQVLIGVWVRRYRSWVTRAEEALTLDDESIHTRPARGRPCPCCLALWVTSERDGERFRDPALVAEFRDGQLQHLLCRACGADWRDDVDELTQWIAENEAAYGPAHLWGETVPRAEDGR
jgi:hypothetical protein